MEGHSSRGLVSGQRHDGSRAAIPEIMVSCAIASVDAISYEHLRLSGHHSAGTLFGLRSLPTSCVETLEPTDATIRDRLNERQSIIAVHIWIPGKNNPVRISYLVTTRIGSVELQQGRNNPPSQIHLRSPPSSSFAPSQVQAGS